MLIPSFKRTLVVPAAPEKISVGVQAIIGACLLNVVIGAGFFQARTLEPAYSPTVGIFVRVLANFIFVLGPALWGQSLPRILPLRGHRALWFWAACGVGTTTTYFFAISYSPVGLVNFLNSGSGIFIAALAPMLAGQRTPRAEWIGVGGAMLGLFLLSQPSAGGDGLSPLGCTLALLSGLCSAGAYLMIARTRRRGYSGATVMMHWTLLNFMVYGTLITLLPITWPKMPGTWLALIVAGIAAAGSQLLTTQAFRRAPASLVACLTYFGAVLSVAVDTLVFGLRYPPSALLGAGVVLAFGCCLPLWRRRRPELAPERATINKI